MRIVKIAALILSGIAYQSYADCASDDENRAYRSSSVVQVSTCWNGQSVAFAKMANGDRLMLGEIEGNTSNTTKVRMSQMLEAHATGSPVSYARGKTSFSLCAAPGYSPEWLTVGKSNCTGIWD